MITPNLVASILCGGMLLTALLMVSRMRLFTLVTLFRLQAVFLALYALIVALLHEEVSLIVVSVSVLFIKVFVIPRSIVHVAHEGGASQRLEAYLRPTLMTFLGVVFTLVAFASAHAALPGSESAVAVSVAAALISLGLFMLISRKGMFGQAFGFLVMENGIFTLGLALSGGMPFFVEIGILFDVMVLLILVTMLMRRAQEEHRSLTTDYLRHLID